MKKSIITFIIATTIGILLLNMYLPVSTLTAQATSTTGTQGQVSVAGLVDNPLSLSLEDIIAMPKTWVEANIYCLPATLVTGGVWTGVKLSYLLGLAGVSPSAVKVAFYAADGFSTDLDLATANREDVILAYEKDGEPLSETLRLVVPGKWGYKWIFGVTSIELVNYDFKGKYESNGYSDSANVDINPTGPSAVPRQTIPNSTSTQPTTPPADTQPSNSSSLAPSQETQNPKLEATAQTTEPVPATLIILAIAVIVVGACLLVYVKKRHH